MGEEHYDVPWEFARRGRAAATRLSIATPDDVHSRSSLASPAISDAPRTSAEAAQSCSVDSINSRKKNGLRLEEPGRSSTEYRRRSAGAGATERRQRVDESCVEVEVDRVEAEKRLQERESGDFLLRWRNDHSAALSLKAQEGILHLKVERRSDHWVVGEGAHFRSIAAAVAFYRRHPLPIRGASHICLKECLSLPKLALTTKTSPAKITPNSSL